jgi:ABC-type transporter lipoprotein component MlaA
MPSRLHHTDRPPRLLSVPLLLAALAMGGCATLPPNATPDARDPFERLNRGVYAFSSCRPASAISSATPSIR